MKMMMMMTTIRGRCSIGYSSNFSSRSQGKVHGRHVIEILLYKVCLYDIHREDAQRVAMVHQTSARRGVVTEPLGRNMRYV